MNKLTHIDILKTEFDSRKTKNRSYSLRAYARDLGISASRLSEVMSGSGGLSAGMAERISEKIGLKFQEKELFLNLINAKYAKSNKARKEAEKQLENKTSDSNYNTISLDGFQLISDWHHFAILSAMELDDFNGTTRWLANNLKIEEPTVESALGRLERLDLVEKNHGKHALLKKSLTTTHDIASLAIRKSHRESIYQALESLDNVPLELRDITSITMAIDTKKIKKAKELIKKFRREMSEFLESGDKKSVYNLNIQLVPVSGNTSSSLHLTHSSNKEKK